MEFLNLIFQLFVGVWVPIKTCVRVLGLNRTHKTGVFTGRKCSNWLWHSKMSVFNMKSNFLTVWQGETKCHVVSAWAIKATVLSGSIMIELTFGSFQDILLTFIIGQDMYLKNPGLSQLLNWLSSFWSQISIPHIPSCLF